MIFHIIRKKEGMTFESADLAALLRSDEVQKSDLQELFKKALQKDKDGTVSLSDDEVRYLQLKREDLPKLHDEICSMLSQYKPARGHYVLDGPVPAWFATAFVHSIHPQRGALNDPRLDEPVLIQENSPEGEGRGENLIFSTTEGPDFTLVEFKIKGGVFDVNKLSGVRAPVVNLKKGVVISGKGPNWLTASLAMAYHCTRWVACWMPGSGATVAMTHHPSARLGSVVPDSEVIAQSTLLAPLCK